MLLHDAEKRSIFENCFARGLIAKKVSKKDQIAKISHSARATEGRSSASRLFGHPHSRVLPSSTIHVYIIIMITSKYVRMLQLSLRFDVLDLRGVLIYFFAMMLWHMEPNSI